MCSLLDLLWIGLSTTDIALLSAAVGATFAVEERVDTEQDVRNDDDAPEVTTLVELLASSVKASTTSEEKRRRSC